MYLCTNRTKEWKQINFRNVDTMLSVQFIYDLYDQYNSDINWFRFKNVCLYYQDNKLWSYTPQEDWDRVLFNIANQFKNPKAYSNPNIIKKCYWYYNRRENLLEDFLNRKQRINLKNLNNQKLYELLFNWYQITLNQIYYINLAPVEQGLQKAINDLEPLKYINVNEINILYSLEENTAVIKEELAFLKEVNNSKNISKTIDKHLEQYDYITIGYGSKPLAREVLIKRYEKIKKMTNSQIDNKIKEIENYPKNIAQQKKIVYKKLENRQLSELFDLAAKLGIMRDRKKALLGKSVKFRNEIIKEISNRITDKKEELKYYTMEDFYELLILGKKLNKEEINRRKEGIYISNISRLFTGTEAREEYYNNLKSVDENTNILKTKKGICASTGKAIGRTRVCLTFEESNKLKDGEILITYGTDFDFMNAIIKSSAIITEEGGILSHASVISRELKKPCIIAFKGITRAVKNGELIEVDANEGTVKILDEQQRDDLKNNLCDGIYKSNQKVNAIEVGNKAYNLALMSQRGLNVPEAYFLSKTFFKETLKKENMLNAYIKYLNNLEKYKNELFELIDNVKIPTSVFEDILDFSKNAYAVRSSSSNEDGKNKSFAGQYVTVLFCSSMESIINGIRKCWKSLLGIGLEEYQHVNSKDLFGGIIIQKMVNADYAGVMFTKDPVSNDSNCMVIECCKGVASKLVDNRVVPDRYFINERTLEITDSPRKNYIPEDKIIELCKIGRELEKYYGCNVDIEWACENNNLYLIQCRPITT